MDFITNFFNLDGYVFLLLGVIGLTVLLLSVIFDGILDGLDFDSDGPLSLTTISSFITFLGFVGYIMNASVGLSAPLSTLVGAASGLVGAGIAFAVMKSLKNDDNNTSVTSENLVGKVGTVVLPIPADSDGYGQIMVTMFGETRPYAAKSTLAYPNGTRVEIVSALSPTSVFVKAATENHAATTGTIPTV